MLDPNEVIPIIGKEGAEGFNTPEKRKAIAIKLQDLIDSGKLELIGQKTRYDRNQKYYENNPDHKLNLPFKNASDHHSPLTQPIIDMIIETVVQPITQADPPIAVRAAAAASGYIPTIEHDVSFLMKVAAWDRALYDVAQVASIGGMAMVRVPFVVTEETYHHEIVDIENPVGGIVYAGVEFEVYHPMETFVYPLTVVDPAKAAVIGHKIELRIQHVREKQKRGEWFNDEVIGTNPDVEEKAGRDSESNVQSKIDSTYKEHQIINLSCGLARMDLNEDGFEEVYEFVLAKDQLLLLDFKPYELKASWYVAGRMTTEHNAFYPSHSIADSLQSLQSYYNELHNKLLDATEFSTGPTVFQLKGQGDSDTDTYSPYEIRYVDVLPEIAQLTINVNIAPIVTMIGQVEKQAYAVAGLGNNDQGQAMPGERTTATEANRVASFTSRRTAGYREKVSNVVERMAYLTLEHYRNNFALLKGIYGDQLKCEDKSMLDMPYVITAAGATLNNSPVQQLEGVKALIQLLPQLQAMDATVLARIDATKLLLSIFSAINLPMGDAILRNDADTDLQSKLMQIGLIVQQITQEKTPEGAANGIKQIIQVLSAPPQGDAGGYSSNGAVTGVQADAGLPMQGM
jgi:hypothetical protein